MKVSLNTIKQLVNFELPPVDELVARINAQLGGVEEVIDLGKKYASAKIIRVVSCEKHPDADRLSVCKVDDDGAVADIERDENGYVQVVCGAPNVHAGMWGIWLPPKATVPASFDDAEPFVLDARKLRGVMSYGMIAAADELAISTDHEGVVELTERDMPSGTQLKAGADVAQTFGLDDVIIDIENKMFTHRPDCFGQLGVAREIAGIFGEQFTSPEWYLNAPEFTSAEGLSLQVFNDATKKSPRFMATTMRSVVVAPSPFWLQATLVRWGVRPINNVVDVTNYIMLLTAQPVHAYDYDKLRGGTIGVRMAYDGEKLTLLNGKVCELTIDDIVIADGEGAIGLAGIMGGGDSEVSDTTTNVVLEVANFDMYVLRKTAMRHGVFTDALARFNKGQSPLQCDRVMKQLMRYMSEFAGAEQASEVIDNKNETLKPVQRDNRVKLRGAESVFVWGNMSGVVLLDEAKIKDTLGVEMSVPEACKLLRNVEMNAHEEPEPDTSSQFEVIAPFWRTDIEIVEDVIEEIGRLHGFDNLPRELPLRSMKPTVRNARRDAKQKIRESMKRLGANELLTYSFVPEKMLTNAEQDVSQAFQIANALSPDLQYYRLSVLPSLLDKVHANIKAGNDEFVLYEIGKGLNKTYHADDDDGLPREMHFVDAVYASKQPHDGAPFYHVRRLADELAKDLGFALVVKAIDEPMDYPVTAPFDLQRSALLESDGGVFIGMIGELKQSVVRDFKLPQYTAAMTLDLEGLQRASEQPTFAYRATSKFPSITQDVSLKVAQNAAYSNVVSLFETALSGMKTETVLTTIEPVSVYQATDDTSHKTITLRVVFTDMTKTLQTDEIARLMDSVAQRVCEQLGAERV